MINTILIDKESAMQELLERKIYENCPYVFIKGKTNNAEYAKELILDKKPDLVFLNTNIIDGGDFELPEYEAAPAYEIIYISHDKQRAIEVMKPDAIGYLLEPIHKEDLLITIRNAQKIIYTKQLLNQLLEKRFPKEMISIPTMDGYEFIHYKKIIRCEGLQKYTKVVSTGQSDIISSYGLGEFKKHLEPFGFYSPHKSFLINMALIKKYNNDGTIIMVDDARIPVARRRKKEFLNILREVKIGE